MGPQTQIGQNNYSANIIRAIGGTRSGWPGEVDGGWVAGGG